MKHLFIYIVIAIVSITALSAQNTSNTLTTPTHQAGFNAGTFFGLAPTYRYNIGNNGFQVSALPIFNDGELSFNGSLGYLRKVARAEHIDFSFVSSFAFGYLDRVSIMGVNTGTQIEMKLGKYITAEGRAGLFAGTTSNGEGRSKSTVLRPSLGVSLMYNFN